MSLPSVNLLHQLPTLYGFGQTFSAAHLPAHPDTMGESNTPIALKWFHNDYFWKKLSVLMQTGYINKTIQIIKCIIYKY